jgi:hypothetical protein
MRFRTKLEEPNKYCCRAWALIAAIASILSILYYLAYSFSVDKMGTFVMGRRYLEAGRTIPELHKPVKCFLANNLSKPEKIDFLFKFDSSLRAYSEAILINEIDRELNSLSIFRRAYFNVVGPSEKSLKRIEAADRYWESRAGIYELRHSLKNCAETHDV